MYTRGQLAVIGKVGRKALRLYHEEGLLIPSYTNEDNGYHYYDESQLATLEKIKRLRKADLSLYEIKQVLDGKASEKDLINGKIKELNSRLQEVKQIVGSNPSVMDTTFAEVPDVRRFERCVCLFIEENVERENLGTEIGKLYERASKENISVTGSHFVLYEGFTSDENLTMRTCLPVRDYDGDDALEVCEEKCLHIRFTDGFSKVGRAHVILKEYAESHGFNLNNKAIEVYNRDMSVDVFYTVEYGR